MSTCILVPAQSGYSAKMPDGLTVNLDGPNSAFAKDIERNPHQANLTWVTDDYGFQYLRSFYKTKTNKGVTPFSVSLIVDDELNTYEARFLPGSFTLSSLTDGRFVVAAQVEVSQLPVDDVFEAEKFVIYQAAGADAETYLNLFNIIVNVDWPTA